MSLNISEFLVDNFENKLFIVFLVDLMKNETMFYNVTIFRVKISSLTS